MQHKSTLGEMTVSDIRHLLVETPDTVTPDTSMVELLRKINENYRTRHVYVVDKHSCLIGSVRMNMIVEYLFPFAAALRSPKELMAGAAAHFTAFTARTARDIMNREPRYVEESTLLSDMAKILMEEKINELPVVDNDRLVIGQVNVYEVIAAYIDELS